MFSDYLRSHLILLREMSFVLTNYASQLKNLFKVTEVTTEFILRLSKTQEVTCIFNFYQRSKKYVILTERFVKRKKFSFFLTHEQKLIKRNARIWRERLRESIMWRCVKKQFNIWYYVLNCPTNSTVSGEIDLLIIPT